MSHFFSKIFFWIESFWSVFESVTHLVMINIRFSLIDWMSWMSESFDTESQLAPFSDSLLFDFFLIHLNESESMNILVITAI